MGGYAAVIVFSPATQRWELMSSGGRVIVFDTAEVAWNWLPLLGGGRPYILHRPTLSICFLEISHTAPNRARVVCPYHPHEAAPWKRHVIWSEWWNGPSP
ncbi:MAG: hypothetical protein ACP5VE_10640 [Chthonomonadales bacterium]